MSENKPKAKPTCFTCGFDIIFDKNVVSQKSGKMIPLDPNTRQPHECQEVKPEQQENKNTLPVTETVEQSQLQPYVDHTLKGIQQIQVFSNPSADGITNSVNNWIKENQTKYQVKLIGQLQQNQAGTLSIAVYYEVK